MYTIYSLSVEGVGVFYIGRTSAKLIDRLKSHYSAARNINLHHGFERQKIFQYCIKYNIPINIEFIDETSDLVIARKLETYWICQFSTWGFNLINKFQLNTGVLTCVLDNVNCIINQLDVIHVTPFIVIKTSIQNGKSYNYKYLYKKKVKNNLVISK